MHAGDLLFVLMYETASVLVLLGQHIVKDSCNVKRKINFHCTAAIKSPRKVRKKNASVFHSVVACTLLGVIAQS